MKSFTINIKRLVSETVTDIPGGKVTWEIYCKEWGGYERYVHNLTRELACLAADIESTLEADEG